MQTSIINRNEAYQTIVDSLSDRRKLIFNFLSANPNQTAQELATNLMLPINEVTGRLTELKEMFLIKEVESKLNHFTKKKNTAYEVVECMSERIDLINRAYILHRDQISQLEADYHKGVSEFTKDIIIKKIASLRSKITKLETILSVN